MEYKRDRKTGKDERVSGEDLVTTEELADGLQYFSVGGYMNIILDDCEVYAEAASMKELKSIRCKGKTYYAVANWK